LHLTAGLLSTVLVCWAAVRLIGVPRVNIQSALHDMKTGVFFSIGTAAANLQTDVDKVILAREESSGTAGAYTAAFRLVYMSFIPVLAIVYAVRSRLFRKGQHGGMTGVLDAVRGVVPVAGGYIVVAVAVIYLAAPAVPWLLGPSYQLSSHVLQLLCVLPVLLAIRAVCAEALVGADGHRRLSYLNVVSACLCLALNLTLVRLYGWRGAVAAAYATQSFMVIALLISIAQRRSAERRATA
jgi:O-antigen/teichoic acid export membrane protein